MSDLLLFGAVLGALIVGHELGHFLVARASGVKVDEFGLGFPPRIATLFRAGGTKFTLNLIPLGGFVKPAGEDDPDVRDGLAGSPKRVRAAVLFAGPLANIALAVLAFTLAFRFAAPDTQRVMISGVDAGSPAEGAGILVDDVVLSVQGDRIDSFESLQAAITDRLGVPTEIQLSRNGEPTSIIVTPRESWPEGQGPIGVTLVNPTRSVAWPEAVSLGVESTWIQFREMIHLPGRLLRGDVAPEEARISGIKGMYDMMVWAGQYDRSTQRPFVTLNLIGVISAGLALANLLPIPALDGGRLMFVAIEAVSGRRVPPRHEGLAHTVGFMLLLALIVYVNLQDFINPISLPR